MLHVESGSTDPIYMRLVLRPAIALSLTGLTLLAFQNCSPMQAKSTDMSSATGVQCRAQMKAEAMQKGHSFKCGNLQDYACERRIFSPDVEAKNYSTSECLEDGSACLNVEVRQFNTSHARAFEPAETFLAGAEYNREEVRCHHLFIYENMAVFEGEGESIAAALAGATDACEKAQESSL